MHRHDSVGEKINSDADTRSPPPVQIALPRLEFSDQTGKPDVRRSRKDVRRSAGPDTNTNRKVHRTDEKPTEISVKNMQFR